MLRIERCEIVLCSIERFGRAACPGPRLRGLLAVVVAVVIGCGSLVFGVSDAGAVGGDGTSCSASVTDHFDWTYSCSGLVDTSAIIGNGTPGGSQWLLPTGDGQGFIEVPTTNFVSFDGAVTCTRSGDSYSGSMAGCGGTYYSYAEYGATDFADFCAYLAIEGCSNSTPVFLTANGQYFAPGSSSGALFDSSEYSPPTGDAVDSGFTSLGGTLVLYIGYALLVVLPLLVLGLGIRLLVKWARRGVEL